MPVVKVSDLAFGRLQSPSLDEAEEFLSRFGMVRVERTADRLYMRGTDPTPYIHVTHLGPSKFLGLGFHLDSEDDLKKAAKAPGAKGIEEIDAPGGGKRVRLADPLGYQVDVIWGQDRVDELPVRKHKVNWGHDKLRRAGEQLRLARKCLLAPDPVDRAVSRGGDDPGAGARRRALAGPALRRLDERVLDRVFGEVEIAEDAAEDRDAARTLVAVGTDQVVYSRYSELSTIGRISIVPERADGISDAHSIASSSESASMRQ